MTIEQLKIYVPTATVETWHQHPNGGGWVHNTAVVPAPLKIPANSFIGEWATVGKGAKVGEGATVGEWAKVGEGATWNVSPLVIIGTRHLVCIPSAGNMKIGCMEHDIAWWRENGSEVAARENYTTDQVKEYAAYFALAEAWMAVYPEEGKIRSER